MIVIPTKGTVARQLLCIQILLSYWVSVCNWCCITTFLYLITDQLWSAYPKANVAPATYDTPFVQSYVRRVIPAVLEGGFEIDQCVSFSSMLLAPTVH